MAYLFYKNKKETKSNTWFYTLYANILEYF